MFTVRSVLLMGLLVTAVQTLPSEIEWDYSSWEPILTPCSTCRKGKVLHAERVIQEEGDAPLIPSQIFGGSSPNIRTHVVKADLVPLKAPEKRHKIFIVGEPTRAHQQTSHVSSSPQSPGSGDHTKSLQKTSLASSQPPTSSFNPGSFKPQQQTSFTPSRRPISTIEFKQQNNKQQTSISSSQGPSTKVDFGSQNPPRGISSSAQRPSSFVQFQPPKPKQQSSFPPSDRPGSKVESDASSEQQKTVVIKQQLIRQENGFVPSQPPRVTVETKSPRVQLVYLPEGSIESLSSANLVRIQPTTEGSPTPAKEPDVTLDSKDNQDFNVKTKLPSLSGPSLPLDVSQFIGDVDFSDKQKRDHEGRVISGGVPFQRPNSIGMSLVTTQGQEEDAKSKIRLLEDALADGVPKSANDGQLPRVFIAPSHISPPPGYVKIPLVPQVEGGIQEQTGLPPTFLTPDSRAPPPGFVKLDLPRGVTHLSRDIPVVVPDSQVPPIVPIGSHAFSRPGPPQLSFQPDPSFRPDASINIQSEGNRSGKKLEPQTPLHQAFPSSTPKPISQPSSSKFPQTASSDRPPRPPVFPPTQGQSFPTFGTHPSSIPVSQRFPPNPNQIRPFQPPLQGQTQFNDVSLLGQPVSPSPRPQGLPNIQPFSFPTPRPFGSIPGNQPSTPQGSRPTFPINSIFNTPATPPQQPPNQNRFQNPQPAFRQDFPQSPFQPNGFSNSGFPPQPFNQGPPFSQPQPFRPPQSFPQSNPQSSFPTTPQPTPGPINLPSSSLTPRPTPQPSTLRPSTPRPTTPRFTTPRFTTPRTTTTSRPTTPRPTFSRPTTSSPTTPRPTTQPTTPRPFPSSNPQFAPRIPSFVATTPGPFFSSSPRLRPLPETSQRPNSFSGDREISPFKPQPQEPFLNGPPELLPQDPFPQAPPQSSHQDSFPQDLPQPHLQRPFPQSPPQLLTQDPFPQPLPSSTPPPESTLRPLIETSARPLPFPSSPVPVPVSTSPNSIQISPESSQNSRRPTFRPFSQPPSQFGPTIPSFQPQKPFLTSTPNSLIQGQPEDEKGDFEQSRFPQPPPFSFQTRQNSQRPQPSQFFDQPKSRFPSQPHFASSPRPTPVPSPRPIRPQPVDSVLTDSSRPLEILHEESPVGFGREEDLQTLTPRPFVTSPSRRPFATNPSSRPIFSTSQPFFTTPAPQPRLTTSHRPAITISSSQPTTPSPRPSFVTTSRPFFTTPSPRPSSTTPSSRPLFTTPSPRPTSATPSFQPLFTTPSPRPSSATPSTKPLFTTPFSRPLVTTAKPKVGISKTSPKSVSSKPSPKPLTTTTSLPETEEPFIDVTTTPTTSTVKVTTYKPRGPFNRGNRRPIIKTKITPKRKGNDTDGDKPVTLFPPFSVARSRSRSRENEAPKDEELTPDSVVTSPPRGTFGLRLRPRIRPGFRSNLQRSQTDKVSSSIEKTDTPRAPKVIPTHTTTRPTTKRPRRLPAWFRRNRSRGRFRATKQEVPVETGILTDDVLENDHPVDFVDGNEFTGAESALVVFSQPPENTIPKETNKVEPVLHAAEEALASLAEEVEAEIKLEEAETELREELREELRADQVSRQPHLNHDIKPESPEAVEEHLITDPFADEYEIIKEKAVAEPHHELSDAQYRPSIEQTFAEETSTEGSTAFTTVGPLEDSEVTTLEPVESAVTESSKLSNERRRISSTRLRIL